MAENIEVAGLVTKIAIDDSQLEKTLSGLDRQMKLVKSEFDKGSSALKGFGSGTDELKLKSDALTRQMEIQNAKAAAYRDALQKSKDSMEKNAQASETLKQRIEQTQAAYEASAKATGKESEETQKLKAELDGLNQEYQRTSKAIDSNARSIDGNTTKANKAEAEYIKLANELKATNAELAKQQSGWTKLSESLDSASKKMKAAGDAMTSAGQTLTMTVTAPLAAIGGLSTKAAVSFESAFAGVRKTVDATEEQFAELSDGIRNMAKDIPVAATEIARVGEAAGQLGIQTDAILGFSRTMVDLGVATNMSSDQAATALARLANITQMPQENFDRLGATVVALGNNLAATESEIVEMGLRIAGAGNIIGLTEDQILSFAGSLTSVGVNAEAGGTAISKLMINIAAATNAGGEDLKNFAAVAGMSSSEFTKAFKDDAATAIVAFIEGLGKINEAGGDTFGVIDALGLSEIRLRDALLRSAGAGDVMRESLELGNKAWRENTALTDEAEQRYKTAESQMQIFRNRITDVGITLGNALIPALLKLLESLQPLIDRLAAGAQWFANLDDSTRNTVIAIAGVTAAVGPLLLVTGKLVTSISGAVAVMSKMSAALAAASVAKSSAALASGTLATATTASAGGMTLASRAATVMGTAVRTALGPIGLAITAISALIAGFSALNKYMNQQSIPTVQAYGAASEKSFNKASGSFKQFKNDSTAAMNDTTKSVESSSKAISDAIVNGAGGGAKKARESFAKEMKAMSEDLKSQINKVKDEISKGSDILNKLGDAIVTSLKKQYSDQEKLQIAAIDTRIESEKKASEQVIKNFEAEFDDRSKALDKQVNAEKKASEQRLKIYDKEYAEKLKLIDEELYAQVKVLQDQIDAIDGQTEAEDKAQKEQERQAKLAELNKQLAAAETAEEREKVQRELTKALAEYERQQLLEQRNAQKEGLKGQIDAAKEAANLRKEQIKEEIEAAKELEKERTLVVQEGLADQKTHLKEHYDGLKESEKERTKAAQKELDNQKEAIKTHFEELTRQENLQAEARKLIVEKNNDEIIQLLNTYNPKWQDAGQSFADSFKNGLNSEMQDMGDAIKEAIDIAPTIDEQVKSLDALEQKLKDVEATLSSSDGGGGGGGGGGIAVGFDEATESVDEFTDSLIEGLIPAVNSMGETAEGMSADVVDAFLGLRSKAITELNTLHWSGMEVTEKTASDIADTFFAMGDDITEEMRRDHADQLEQMGIFLANSKELTEQEKEDALNRLKEAHLLQENEVIDGQNRVAEIMLTALEEKRTITQQEYDDILKIREDMSEIGVRVLTENVDDQLELLERLKNEASSLSAQQAADVIKNINKQRDETVKTAENQYQLTVTQIKKQRDELKTISSEQADKLIEEAERLRDETVKNAEEMHEKVVKEAKDQAKEHIDNVNWETGEILTRWESFKAGWNRIAMDITKSVRETFTDAWSEGKRLAGKLKDDVVERFDKLKTGTTTALDNTKESFTETWNTIVNFLEGINLKDIGTNIVNSLTDGIKSSAAKLKTAVTDMASGLPDWVKKPLKIQSPSRVFMEIGGNVGEGFEIGMKNKVSDIEKQARMLANAAIPGMEAMAYPTSGSPTTAAGANGGVVNNYSFEGFMKGANFTVRSDNDIRAIAQELFNVQRAASRGAGLAWP